jgi:hypothetical protein
MSSFNCFDVQYTLTILFQNSGILAIRKRAGLSIAETRHVMRIPTKCLSLCPARHRREFSDSVNIQIDFIASISSHVLGLERAELLVDDLPNHLIALH